MLGSWKALVVAASALSSLFNGVSAQAANASQAATYIYSDGGNGNLTFTITVNPNNHDLWFRLSAPSMYSWVAIGTGNQMENSNMFVAYEGAKDNTITLSSRKSTGNNEPSYMNVGLQSVSIADKKDPHSGESSIHDDTYFINGYLPNGTAKYNIDPESINWFIFAVGPQGHDPRTDAKDGPLRRHAWYGSFQVDMKQAHGTSMPLLGTKAAGIGTKSSQKTDHDFSSAGHAFVMGLCFAIILPLGVLFLRVMESVKLHMFAQSFGLFLAVVGTFSGLYVSRSYNRSKNYSNPHQIVGIIIFLLIIVQWVFGFLHHRTYKRTQLPTWMIKPHKFVIGPLVMVLGIVNVAFGFRFAVSGQDNLFYVPIVIAVVILMVVAITLKKVFAKKRRNKNVPFGGPMPGSDPAFGAPGAGYGRAVPSYEPNRPYAGGYENTRSDIQLESLGDPPSYSQQPQKPATFL